MTALTDQLRIAFNEGKKQKEKELSAAWPDLRGIGVEIPGPDDDPLDPEAPYSTPLEGAPDNQNLTISGLLLPGESPSGGRGGLGSMNKDQLERWIKENGISGSGADKIRNKWQNLGPRLPLAQINYGQPSELDKLLGPNQGPGGSLRHMNDKERKDLLIRGTKV